MLGYLGKRLFSGAPDVENETSPFENYQERLDLLSVCNQEPNGYSTYVGCLFSEMKTRQ